MECSVFNKTEEKMVMTDDEMIKIVETVLKTQEKNIEEPWEVTLIFVDKKKIRSINKQYREKDKTTDVISFAFQEGEDAKYAPFLLGDIFICPQVVKRHAKNYGITEKQETTFMIVHGTLHLLGFDHKKKKDRVIMRQKEAEIMKELGYEIEIEE